MSDHRCAHHRVHRVPRARIDPIDNRRSALALIFELINPEIRPETIIVLLDHQRRGLSIVVVSGANDAHTLLPTVEMIVEQAHRRDEVGGVLLASVRPGADADDHDRGRWVEATDLCEQVGLELVEWFVLGRRVICPRELCGEPPRWRP